MRPSCHLAVTGANTHLIPRPHLEQLQALVTELGAARFPLFFRLGGQGLTRMQPITARSLLSEVEEFLARLADQTVPALLFADSQQRVLGGMLGRPDGARLAGSDLLAMAVTDEGIRLTLTQFPPPVGFRSGPGLKAGTYLCYFDQITRTPDGFAGLRTIAMGGSGAPVALPDLPLPPVTAWDFAAVAGKPSVAELRFMRMPVKDAYRDALHALVTATNDSIRLKVPLQIRFE